MRLGRRLVLFTAATTLLGSAVAAIAAASPAAYAATTGTPGATGAQAQSNNVLSIDVIERVPMSDMIFSVATIVAHLSKYQTLLPGDVVLTGTPAGVGPVASGDRLEGSIEGVGELTVTIGDVQ